MRLCDIAVIVWSLAFLNFAVHNEVGILGLVLFWVIYLMNRKDMSIGTQKWLTVFLGFGSLVTVILTVLLLWFE